MQPRTEVHARGGISYDADFVLEISHIGAWSAGVGNASEVRVRFTSTYVWFLETHRLSLSKTVLSTCPSFFS